jgi:hypothetical protein
MHPSFERLTRMKPCTSANVPKNAPSECIYLFSEGERHMYVGRTRFLHDQSAQVVCQMAC